MSPIASSAPSALSGSLPGQSAGKRAAAPWRTDVAIYVILVLLVGSAWWVSLQGWFTSWSRQGYWLGVAGGVAMLALFTYPLRKRLRWAQAWGASKYWFAAHMILGVAGPWLILLHSTFKIGSTNAAVALFSMVIVALSGVVGRFLYVRLHADLRGEKASLGTLRHALGIQHEAADSRLQSVPRALAVLQDFELAVLGGQDGAAGRGHMWRLLVLPWTRRNVVAQCQAAVKQAIKQAAKDHRWNKDTALAQYRLNRDQVEDYAQAVQRVAQFQTFERLFSLWHVAHVPFVWIMVVCAIFHVVAVHAY
jgi:hypothetical protein